MANQIACVYVTTSNKEEAEKIARVVVDERLAACANVFDGATSFFRWQGKTIVAQEAVLFIKTNQTRIDDLIERVRKLHSYDNPCIVSWAIDKGAPDFLNWVCQETIIGEHQ